MDAAIFAKLKRDDRVSRRLSFIPSGYQGPFPAKEFGVVVANRGNGWIAVRWGTELLPWNVCNSSNLEKEPST